MMTVVFRRPHAMYNAGEAAGFDEEAAQRLISSGVAYCKDMAAPVVAAQPAELAKAEETAATPEPAATSPFRSGRRK